jgi:hypothetical protein
VSRSIGSAVGRLMAVFDRWPEVEAAMNSLVAAGFDRTRIETFEGSEAAAAFDSSGRHRGLAGRLFRIIEFSWADQAPDFAWYEAAVREGRVVLSVRVRGQREVKTATEIVIADSGHFVNHFGWFETQELARWRGKEPDLPGFLHR